MTKYGPLRPGDLVRFRHGEYHNMYGYGLMRAISTDAMGYTWSVWFPDGEVQAREEELMLVSSVKHSCNVTKKETEG